MSVVDRFANAAAFVRRNIWWEAPTGILLIVIVYIFIFVSPFSDSTTGEPSDVPSAWNRGVGQLGISPLYPPQEDFFVGDIWAVIVDSPDPSTTGRGVRIGHIDLSDAIKSEGSRAPAFLKSTPNVAPRYIYSLAFPGISIYHSSANSGKSWLSALSFNASRTNDLSDQLNISEAQTYGADINEALIKLYEYCGSSDNGLKCTNSFIRHVLATVIDEKISADVGKASRFQIRLHLITRVYLTSGITHKRVVDGTVSVAGSATTPEAMMGAGGDKTPLPTGEVTRKIGDKSELSFEEKFATPLVFGFRSAVFTPN